MSANKLIDVSTEVIVVCRNSNGAPDFALVVVACPEASMADGQHYELASAAADSLGYQEPYIFFDEKEAPQWLKDGVRSQQAPHHTVHCTAVAGT
jgi:hypothetical protein